MPLLDHKNETFDRLYGTGYLLVLALIVFAGFLNTTMFPVRIPDRALKALCAALAGLIAVRCVWKKRPDNVRTAAGACAISACMAVSWMVTRHGYLLELAFLILGAYGVPFRRILKVYLGVSVPFLAVTVCMALTGHIRNLVFYRGDQIRMSFGIHYPTDFCAHIFFLICCWVWLRAEKITIAETVLTALTAVFCYVMCGARTTMLCLLLLAGLLAGIRLMKQNGIRNGILKKILLAGVPLSCILSVALAVLYRDGSPLMVKINALLSNRPRLGHIGLERYPLVLFGQIVEMHGSGGTTEVPEEYFFLDSSYMYILLCLGICTLLAVMAILIKAALEAYRAECLTALAVLAVICLECFMEHHLISIGYHPFLLLFAAGQEISASEGSRGSGEQ